MYPPSIPLCSLLTPFLKPRYLSWTSHSASQVAESVRPFTTKTPTPMHNYLHYTSSHLKHCKNGIPYSQFLRLRRLCSEDDDFLQKCQEMSTFFESRGYPSDLLQITRERVSSVTRQEALVKRVRENDGRIPLVLTYHPLTSCVKHILLNNFNILTTNPSTATIFPAPPVIAHRRNLSLRDVLVHTSDRSQTEIPGTFACRHPRCRTCLYTSSNVHVCGPKSSTTIHERFTCKSDNIVYCISCRRCPQLYIGETGRTLHKRFGEHLRSLREVFWCQFQTEAVRNATHF